jgi:putative membrane protein
MWHMGDGWGWWMIMGWIWMVVFWTIIVWAVITLAGRLGAGRSSGETDSPMAVLERRYGAGEISKEEFEERRSTLLEARRR